MTGTTRHFLDLEGRTVHLRLTGSGPPFLLLHGSPQSGAALSGMSRAGADAGFTAIAPDTPGNGLSDPLPGSPRDCTAYARAIDTLLGVLGVQHCAVYGFHTGAVHAAALAEQFPSRVSALVLDGLPLWTPAERARLLANYLPVNRPRADGSHLAWLWTRAEDQAIFFPWFDATAGARMAGRDAPPPAEKTHDVVLDFLRADDHYRAPYASAFQADGEALLSRIAAPALLCAAENDPLFLHLDRVRTRAATLRIERFGADREDAWRRMARWIGENATTASRAAPTFAPHPRRGFLHIEGRDIHWRGGLSAGGAPRLFLHDAGGSLRHFSAETDRAGGYAIDLPGHGETGGPFPGDDEGVAALCTLIEGVMEQFDLKTTEITGCGLGARLAERLATHGRVAGVDLLDGWEDDGLDVSLSPRWDGAHLLTAWRLARRRALGADDPVAPWRNLRGIHRRAVDLVKSGAAFADATLAARRRS